MTRLYSRIIGTGAYAPDQVVTNDDLAKRVDATDEWIASRTGIRERRVMPASQVTSDMVVEAGRRALDAAGLRPADLDLIVVATVTADMPMPSCAVIAQMKLGATCPAFDVAAACAGFSYGLTVVNGLIRAGTFRTVLFVGAEALTRYLDWEDRGTCVLFGDGAGAIVVRGEARDVPPTSREARGILATSIAADGSLWGELNILGGGTQHPPTHDTVNARLHTMRMNGRAIFSHAVRMMSDACEKVLAATDLAATDVNLVVPHQANLRIIEAIVRRLEIAREKVFVNIERYGNTSSASIPIALDEAVRSGRVHDGDNLLLCGLGAGLVWGAALIRW